MRLANYADKAVYYSKTAEDDEARFVRIDF